MPQRHPPAVMFGAALILTVVVACWGTTVLHQQAGGAMEHATASERHEPATPPQQAMNPHSDLIFRATGATSCTDCHRVGTGDAVTSQVLDNTLVRDLKAKAKGVHGPGRFADCLRCHAGGDKGVEKYRR